MWAGSAPCAKFIATCEISRRHIGDFFSYLKRRMKHNVEPRERFLVLCRILCVRNVTQLCTLEERQTSFLKPWKIKRQKRKFSNSSRSSQTKEKRNKGLVCPALRFGVVSSLLFFSPKKLKSEPTFHICIFIYFYIFFTVIAVCAACTPS